LALLLALFGVGALVHPSVPALACTTFCAGDSTSMLFGKNYDYHFDDGFLVVNQRGVAKGSLSDGSSLRWASVYGSVTFNQYGRELPCGGMNEAGLVVELMWLDDTRYPAADARGALPALQWIQYQLDTCASVAEVLASDRLVRIEEATSAKIHYLVADATGDAATIEWLDGTMIVHRGEGLPVRALANDTYERSLTYLAGLGAEAPGATMSSLDRFARAGRRSASLAAGRAAAVGAAFDVLADVAQGDFTCWSIVYDVTHRDVHFRTRDNERVRTLRLPALEFRCDTPVMMLDVNAPVAGDARPSLVPYSLEQNAAFVRGAFAKTDFLQSTPAEVIDALARAPEGMPCLP